MDGVFIYKNIVVRILPLVPHFHFMASMIRSLTLLASDVMRVHSSSSEQYIKSLFSFTHL